MSTTVTQKTQTNHVRCETKIPDIRWNFANNSLTYPEQDGLKNAVDQDAISNFSLTRDHFSASCKKSIKCDVMGCGKQHLPLLHGWERVFPSNQGKIIGKKSVKWLFVSRPVLIALVPMIVKSKDTKVETSGVPWPGYWGNVNYAGFKMGLSGKKMGLSGTKKRPSLCYVFKHLQR